MGDPPVFTVLVVDDNETNLDLLSRRLSRKGYAVIVAQSGKEALELVSTREIHLVLLDVMMPGMSGLEVLEVIRSTRGPHDLPVIMATARAEGSDVVAALDQGANDYVTKPIDIDVLLARMRVHLRRPATARPVHEKLPDAYVGPGVELGGKYRLDAVLGSGGFGTVYRALHLSLEKDVAIKVLHPHLVESEAAIRRFQQEGVSGCRVRHPNAVAILDSGSTAGNVPFLVMELLDGPTLQEDLEQLGVLPLSRIAEIICPVCDVLIEAHRSGIVHRDIKPANILLARSPVGELIKVLDFGIAKLVGADGAGMTVGDTAGTPYFIAPERLLGEPSDARSDIYSVGVTLYQMLTGAMPFEKRDDNPFQQALQQLQTPPRPLETFRPDLPSELTRLVMSALDSEPQARPDLGTLRTGISTLASQWVEPAWPPPTLADHVPVFAETRAADQRSTVELERAAPMESGPEPISAKNQSGEILSNEAEERGAQSRRGS